MEAGSRVQVLAGPTQRGASARYGGWPEPELEAEEGRELEELGKSTTRRWASGSGVPGVEAHAA